MLKTLLKPAFLALIFCITLAQAGERHVIDTRPGVKTTVYFHATPAATQTVFIFPGGGGGFGKVENGWPQSGNFLVRTTELWVKQGFNVAIFGRPADMDELDYPDRISAKHLDDVKAATTWIKQQSPLPIWFVGTSRGTISVVHALAQLQDAQIAGAVLSSSVVSPKKTGNLPSQALENIKLPVLVYHHQNDACAVCRPADVPAVISGLKNAPVKQLMMVSGGANPVGNPCEAHHYHGYIGMEAQAVADIAGWVKAPVNR